MKGNNLEDALLDHLEKFQTDRSDQMKLLTQ